MKQIKLTQGIVAMVDYEDYEELSKHKWHASKQGKTHYAERRVGYRGPMLKMHRVILGLQPGDGTEVDHINHNGCDNRKSNLRTVNHAVNIRNHSLFLTNTSGYTGVCRRGSKWIARIGVNYKDIYLGCFDNINDAIEARRRGEQKHWNETV